MTSDLSNKPKTILGKLKRLWLENQFTIILLFGFVVVLFFVWHFLSDGDFSFLMTLGSMLVLFGFGLLVAKALLYRKLSNLSYKTLQAYALVFMARLSSILFYEGYLPYDKSGDWFYQTVEVTALVLSVGLVVAVHMGVKTSDKDKFDEKLCEKLGVAGKDAGALVLVVPVLILAVILHPSLNNNWLTDVAWTFALYLEAVAIFPQLYVIKSTRAEIDPLELNFVFSLAVARLLHFVFWVSSYQELNDKNSGRLDRKFPGYFVVGSQLVNLALLSDFVVEHLTHANAKEGYLPTSV